jgi:hypothetical protein
MIICQTPDFVPNISTRMKNLYFFQQWLRIGTWPDLFVPNVMSLIPNCWPGILGYPQFYIGTNLGVPIEDRRTWSICLKNIFLRFRMGPWGKDYNCFVSRYLLDYSNGKNEFHKCFNDLFEGQPLRMQFCSTESKSLDFLAFWPQFWKNFATAL